MTPYRVVRPWEADPIKTLGVSRSIHLIDLGYGALPPYTPALIAGIQRRADGNMELWGVKQGSGNVYVSASFSPALITSISGGNRQGVISGGAFLWFVAIFDSSASYAIQSLAVYQPAPAPSKAAGTQLALIDFTGAPAIRLQEQQVQPGFVLAGVSLGAGAVDLTQMDQSALFG